MSPQMGSLLIPSTQAVTVSDQRRITIVIILQLIIYLVNCPQAIVPFGVYIWAQEHLAPDLEFFIFWTTL